MNLRWLAMLLLCELAPEMTINIFMTQRVFNGG